jgi:hypothetical protein
VDDEQRAQRAVTIAVIALAAVVGTALVALGPGSPTPPTTVEVAEAAVTTTDVPAVVTTTTVAPPTSPPPASSTTRPGATTTTTAAPTSTTVDPGALPQTDDRPTASGATFTAHVDGLWEAIRQDRPELALPFFFPESAYLQVKAISDPAGDYEQRLIANYEQDVHSLHAQLGGNAASAQLVGLDVPDSQAVWVQPGEEYNKGSYWRVYGSTLQYQVDGQTASFAVTSLISWRGEWYVVHLGAIR